MDNDTLVKRRIDMTTFKEAIGTAAGLQADPNGNFTNGQVNVVTVQFDQPKEEEERTRRKWYKLVVNRWYYRWLISALWSNMVLLS